MSSRKNAHPSGSNQRPQRVESARVPRRDDVSEQQITSNDITALKKELNSLTQQKTMLKAKIQRLNDTLKNHRPRAANQQMLNQLKSEMKKVEQYNENRRQEISAIMMSDLAAEITEQQQESLLLYQEINRIMKRKKEATKELENITEQLDAANKQYNEENLKVALNKVAMLQKEIETQEQRNEKLRAQIEEAEEEKSRAEIESDENLQREVALLEQKIQAEQATAADLDKEIEETKKKYDEELQQIQNE